jgi:hypothetical protein
MRRAGSFRRSAVLRVRRPWESPSASTPRGGVSFRLAATQGGRLSSASVTTPPVYPVYPVDAIAKLLNLTPRRVQQLAREGIIPRAEKGKYDLIRTVRGYVKYLQEQVALRRVEPSELHDERTRLLTAQARKAEIEIAALERSLLPFDGVVQAWQQLVAAFRARCLALPSKLARISHQGVSPG